MRKLLWFAVGFALVCLLLAGDVSPVWLILPAGAMAAGWQVTHPRDRQQWLELTAHHPRQHMLWQIFRRGAVVAVGCGVGLCWFCVYHYLVCLPALSWAGCQDISGTVLTWPQQTQSQGYALVLRLDGGPQVKLYVAESWAQLQPGDYVQARGELEGVALTDPAQVSYYAAKGIFLQGSCPGIPTVERPPTPPVISWPALAARQLKHGIQMAFDPGVWGLAQAVALGDKAGLEESLYQSMVRAGVLHAAVVSGLHISFLVGMMMLLCRSRSRWAMAMIPVLIFYAVMAGNTPSAFRAVWMQVAVLAVPWVGRERDSLCALALALLILLVQNPFSVYSVGLQLSFLSVAGILTVTPGVFRCLTTPLEQWQKAGCPRVVRRGWRWLSASVSASLGAMALTMPLVGAVFGQVSVIAPVTNILVLWAITALMICALAVGLLALWLPGAALVLGQETGLLGHYTVWVVQRMGAVPHGVLYVDQPYHVVWLTGAYLVGFLLVRTGATAARMGMAGVGLTALLLLPVGLEACTVGTSQLVVKALNVGQGSATLLLTPGSSVLVDCGGSAPTSAGDVAADALAGVGRARLDALVLTHLDDDHFNGVQRLLQRVEVDRVVVPISARAQTPAGQLDQWLEEGEIPVVWVEQETALSLEGLELTLYPPLGSGTTNEEGLFALCTAGDFDVLITGDADSYVERMLVKYFSLPDIEVLVVGHHGAEESTCMELLGRTCPELAIISTEKDNDYGHPAPEVLERLWRAGAQVHRTDLEGTVTVVVRGENVGIW